MPATFSLPSPCVMANILRSVQYASRVLLSARVVKSGEHIIETSLASSKAICNISVVKANTSSPSFPPFKVKVFADKVTSSEELTETSTKELFCTNVSIISADVTS